MQNPGVSTESCGCDERPRRVCDVCRSPTFLYTACSRACLERHLAEAHADVAGSDVATRALNQQTMMNRQAPDTWDRYAAHRERVMELLPYETDGTLVVFGAGNCSDIDLERLTATFGAVHLVDLDPEALERARERQSENARDRIVTHGNIDLSGFLARIDDWGERLPPPAELGPLAVQASKGILQRLGERFDVSLSSCVLSQLVHPFRRSLVLSGAEWVQLEAAFTGLHLTTLAGATRSGGHGLVVFDVLSSAEAPELETVQNADSNDLQMFVMREIDRDRLRPDPWNLARQLAARGPMNLFASPRLTPPWLWDIRTGLQLVYALAFDRP